MRPGSRQLARRGSARTNLLALLTADASASLAAALLPALGSPTTSEAWAIVVTVMTLSLYCAAGLYAEGRVNRVVELRSLVLWGSTAVLLAALIAWPMLLQRPGFVVLSTWLGMIFLIPIVRSALRGAWVWFGLRGSNAILLEGRQAGERVAESVRKARSAGVRAVDVVSFHEVGVTWPQEPVAAVSLPGRLAPELLRRPPASARCLMLDPDTPTVTQVWTLSDAASLRWPLEAWYSRLVKRSMDLLLCLLTAPIVLPLGLVLAAIVRGTSTRPGLLWSCAPGTRRPTHPGLEVPLHGGRCRPDLAGAPGAAP